MKNDLALNRIYNLLRLIFQAKSGVRIEDNKRASIIKFKSSSRFGAKVANGSCFRKPNTRIREMCQLE